MGMTCTVCNHPERPEIDKMLAEGLSHTKIGKQHGLSNQAVRYHYLNHLPQTVVQAHDVRQQLEGSDLLMRIDQIICRAEMIFTRNFNDRKDLVALRALSEQRSTIELLAKISAFLHQTKQAELEAAERASGILLQEGIAILSDAELKLYDRILEKIETQDPNMVILPGPKTQEAEPLQTEPEKPRVTQGNPVVTSDRRSMCRTTTPPKRRRSLSALLDAIQEPELLPKEEHNGW